MCPHIIAPLLLLTDQQIVIMLTSRVRGFFVVYTKKNIDLVTESLIKKLANFFERKKVTASVCMVEAISPSIWSTKMNKIWVPHNLVVHNQKAQEELIKCANYNTANTIRLSARK